MRLFPALGDVIYTIPDVSTGFVSEQTFAQQFIVVSLEMADVRDPTPAEGESAE